MRSVAPFLAAAREGGAADCIGGKEMLVCQGIVQFQLFTGATPSYEELEAGFVVGQQRRGR